MILEEEKKQVMFLIKKYHEHLDAAQNTWADLVNYCDSHPEITIDDLTECWKEARPEIREATARNYAGKIIRISNEVGPIKEAVKQGLMSGRKAAEMISVPQRIPRQPRQPKWITLLVQAIVEATAEGVSLVSIAQKVEEIYRKVA